MDINRAIDQNNTPDFTKELNETELNQFAQLQDQLKNKKKELLAEFQNKEITLGEVNNKLFDEFEKLSGL